MIVKITINISSIKVFFLILSILLKYYFKYFLKNKFIV